VARNRCLRDRLGGSAPHSMGCHFDNRRSVDAKLIHTGRAKQCCIVQRCVR
jgi:hypothetical protein